MADTTAKEVTRKFTLEKLTKNTVKLTEQTDGQPPIIGTLYVQQWWMGDSTNVELTIKKL